MDAESVAEEEAVPKSPKKWLWSPMCNICWTTFFLVATAFYGLALLYFGITRINLCPWDERLPMYAAGI